MHVCTLLHNTKSKRNIIWDGEGEREREAEFVSNISFLVIFIVTQPCVMLFSISNFFFVEKINVAPIFTRTIHTYCPLVLEITRRGLVKRPRNTWKTVTQCCTQPVTTTVRKKNLDHCSGAPRARTYRIVTVDRPRSSDLYRKCCALSYVIIIFFFFFSMNTVEEALCHEGPISAVNGRTHTFNSRRAGSEAFGNVSTHAQVAFKVPSNASFSKAVL